MSAPIPRYVAVILAITVLLALAGCGGGGDAVDGTKSTEPTHCDMQPRPADCQ